MAQPIDILLDSPQPLTDLAQTLNKLLDIDLQPAVADEKAYYTFRAMTLTLDLYEVSAANEVNKEGEEYRYHISISGIFGSELQRKKMDRRLVPFDQADAQGSAVSSQTLIRFSH